MSGLVWSILFKLGAAIILSTSSYQECKRQEGLERLSCRVKLFANFGLSSNMADSDELVIKTLSTSSTKLAVAVPVTVKLRKPEAHRSYLLNFVQVVHGKPQEHSKVLGSCACEDYKMHKMPQVCPEVPEKLKVARSPNSEGFCCPCREATKVWSGMYLGRARVCKDNINSLDAFLNSGLPAKQLASGSALVKAGSKKFSVVVGAGIEIADRLLNKACSVHCLTLAEENWYAVFDISPPNTDYTVEVEVEGHIVTLKSETSSTVEILTPNLSGQATLIGDYASIKSHEIFNSVKLVARIKTKGKFDDLTSDDIDIKNAYVIPNAYFDLTGYTCNKIGVTDVAFNTQMRVCDGIQNECLDDQIDDLIKNGIASPVFPKDEENRQHAFCFNPWQEDGKLIINCPYSEGHVTRVNLSLFAEDLVAIVGDPPILIESYMIQSQNSSCDSDNPCWVTLFMKNLDDTLSGSYFVGIENCHGEIHDVVEDIDLVLDHGAAAVSIGPNCTERVQLRFHLQVDLKDNTTYTCQVVVTSESEGVEVTRHMISIDGRPSIRKGRDDHLKGLSTDDSQENPVKKHDNCDNCRFMDVVCITKNACLGNAIGNLCTLGLGAAGIFILINLAGPVLSILSTSVKCTISALQPLMTGPQKKSS